MCSFGDRMSTLRRARELSQRKAAAELGISQALLSHYENGSREPGLSFVVRACDYYGVSADYILGRTENSSQTGVELKALSDELRTLSERMRSLAEGSGE